MEPLEAASTLADDSQVSPTAKTVPDTKQEVSLSHPEALQKAKELVSRLLSDPFLHDLPPDISLDDLRSKLALEQGKAVTLHLRRYDGDVIPIIVFQGATVQDLKKAIEKETTRRCRKDGRTIHLSWRYVWRTYWLAHGQQRLDDLQAKLARYGISNHSEITFVKKLRQEGKRQGTRRN